MMKRSVLAGWMPAAVAALALLLASSTGAEAPETINLHGSLMANDGSPITGVRAYRVRFYDAESGGGQLGGDLAGTTEVSDAGLFNLAVTVPAEALDNGPVWYELAIDTDVPADGDASDDVFPERIRVHSVPFALQAAEVSTVNAASIAGGSVDNGEFETLDGAAGALQPQIDAKADDTDLTAHTANTANPHAVTKAQVGLSNVDDTSDLGKPLSTSAQTALDAKADDADLTAHAANTTNPHAVTKVQVGLGNVDNTSDLGKPVSTAAQTALDAKADDTDLTSHTANTTNPHAVTKAQVGLGNVDNTSDLGKPLSTSAQTALDAKADDTDLTAHTANTTNPHAVTKVQVGLGNVDNTSDLGKPVSTAAQAALDAKANTTDLTAHTASTANPHVVTAAQVGLGNVDNTSDLDKPVSTVAQTALDAKADDADLTVHESDTGNPHAVSAAQVGLGNADNTSDADKPVSTATQAALDLKLRRTSQAYVVVEVGSDAAASGANLLAAYAAAKALTPFGGALSATNRAVVLVPPGNYDLGASPFAMDTDYVDLVGLSTARDDQYIYRADNVLVQTASNVRIENLLLHYTGSSTNIFAYYPNVTWNTTHTGSPPATRVRNCEFRATNYDMWYGVEYAGFYENCTSGSFAFGGGSGGIASGTFVNCTGGTYSFGGGSGGTVSGTFTNCTGGSSAFGGGGGTVSGTFTNCTGGNSAFGDQGAVSGTFTNCTGGQYSFGAGSGNTTGASLYGCRMTGTSWDGTFRGRMENCRWACGITCGAEARIYRSTLLGNLDLNNTTAGAAHCEVKGSVLNTGSASFDSWNLGNSNIN